MAEMSETETVVDLTDGPEADDEVMALRARLAEVEAELQRTTDDLGRLQLQVELFSSTDPVTGLVNRGGTIEAIETAMERGTRMDESFGVVAVRIPELDVRRDELDDDELVEGLQHLAALIAGGLRRLDRVGRMVDDTFVTVLSNVGEVHIGVVLERIVQALTGAPVQLGETTTAIRPRLAATVVTPTGVASIDPDRLLDDTVRMSRTAGTTERPLVIR